MHGKVRVTLPAARLSPSVTFPDIRVVEGRVQERRSQRTAHTEGDSQSLRLLAGVSGEAERGSAHSTLFTKLPHHQGQKRS